MKEEAINLFEYTYPDGVMIEIPGKLLEGLIQILDTVDKKETVSGFIHSYPVDSKEVFREDNFLESVDVSWKDYTTAESFFNQKPQETKSMLGVMSLDLLLLLKKAHLDNIDRGIAKKVGSFEQKVDEDVKLEKK